MDIAEHTRRGSHHRQRRVKVEHKNKNMATDADFKHIFLTEESENDLITYVLVKSTGEGYCSKSELLTTNLECLKDMCSPSVM